MSLFRRKNKYDDIDMTLLDDEDFYIGAKKAGEEIKNHHSLTADEIEGAEKESYSQPSENPLEELRKKMLARSKTEETSDDKEQNEENTNSFFNIDSSFLDNEEKQEDNTVKDESANINALEQPVKIQKGETITLVPEEIAEENQEKSQNTSLLENCLPFIMDGNNGEYTPNSKPSYTLDSVASILGIEEEEEAEEEKESTKSVKEEAGDIDKTIVFSAIEDTGELPDISDIDTKTKTSSVDISSTSTMPVIIPDEMISSTRNIDISSDIFGTKPPVDLGLNEAKVQEEYESFTPEFEYNSKDDRKKIRRKLLAERRSRFIKFICSLLGLIILTFLALPAFSDLMLTFSTSLAVFTFIGFALPVISNYDIVMSLPSLFTKRTSCETGIAFSVLLSVFSFLLALFNKLPGEVYYGLSLMTTVSLTFRSYFRLRRSQYIYTNFKRISSDNEKYGITLIDDVPTTFAMARKAIDGDILIAAPKRTEKVTDFMKNSTFDVDLDGRARLFFCIGFAFSFLVGIAYGLYRSDFMSGAITACAFATLFAPLTSLACSILPLSSAATHLNRYGAVLTGLRAARQIEAANACVIDCDALFPKGSIKLINMKVISQNNLEETIASACAITTNIKSPLAPVFKTVMETNKAVAIPVADSIKYEERLGVTGWVGNKRIFIGNRALMLAHEIPVPDAETDKKLMRDGYFPVYVACDGKACALLVLKYVPNPDIAKELDRISAMGLTILINNCDQNISEEMVCDYFDLYSDSVKIMSGSGVHMYKTAANFEESMNAGAVIRPGAAAMAATVYCANRVKRANILLQLAHVISIVLGVIIFSYIIFGNASLYTNCIYIALYQLSCFVVSGIAYLFTKP